MRLGVLGVTLLTLALAVAPAHASTLPTSFQETVAISGLTHPTVVRFAADGRVFVAEKSGLIKEFDSLSDTTPTTVADLRAQVQDYWDRGLLGFVLDPSFPTKPYAYVLYAFDAAIGGIAPRWGDACPTPPGPTTDGCLVSGRLSRLTISGNVSTGEQVLINDWCQQYPSHSIGDLEFGPDGSLYVSGGDGASFDFTDYGQKGTPLNPCGDPPVPAGGTQTPPTAEGGALRSQSVRRTAGEPATLGGAILRVDPATGAGVFDNPLAGSLDANTRRIVAYGLRNPFRIALRPGTTELWVGDVGWSTWEEINRIANPRDATVENFGWPCYEGVGRQPGYDAANLNICESLYTSGAVTAPHYTYNHSAKIVAGETCPTGGSSISGMAFYGSGGYPASYNGALFFADHSRNCIWTMPLGANGDPDPSKLLTFAAGAAGPVDIVTGPGGDLFYVGYDDGTIRRIEYIGANRPPNAIATATPTSGNAPLTVQFDGSGSYDSDPGDTITYAWDLNGDGVYDDSTAAKPSWTYTKAGTYNVKLKVTDNHGVSSVSPTLPISASNTPPSAAIASPSSTLTWKVGDMISFSGSATDAQDGTLPASALTWTLVIQHCPSNCHSHVVQTWTGVASGSFAAPDHEYPSYLELQLTATDSSGSTDTKTVRLDPQTVSLTFQSNPTGLQLVVGSTGGTAPFSRTVIIGSANSVSATTPQTLGATSYDFTSWSDGAAQTHTITAPALASAYTATYKASSTPPAPGLVAAYGFNEGTGTKAADISGSANDGTTANTTWSTSGKFGGALSFNGTSSWVTVADANSLDLTNGMTLEAWVKPAALGTAWRTVIFKEAPGGIVYTLYANEDTSKPVGQAFIGGEQNALGTATLALNVWSHVAVTYDGAALKLYVNGTLIGSKALSGAMAASTGALRIGGNSVWPEWFNGLIDEVRVYNRSLTATEIGTDMNTPVGGSPPPADTTPPTAAITTPTSGATVSATVDVTATASDDRGVAGVQFKLDGALLGNEVTSPPYTISWNTRAATNGQHTLTAVARDAANNTGASANVTVTVTNTGPPPGLVASYGFNEGAGWTTVADSSGSGNNGTVANTAWTTAGKYGSALTFNGTSSWVTVADSNSLDLTNGMTLEAWVKPAALGTSWRTVIFKEAPGGLVYTLYGNEDTSKPVGQVFVGGEKNALGTATLTLNVWTHLTVTFDGLIAKLYVNGALAGTSSVTGAMSPSTGALRIGGNAIWPEWFSGQIDEVRIYNRALTATEIGADMNAPLP